jgi:parvulin-like peptidyl-prolyl isomerase
MMKILIAAAIAAFAILAADVATVEEIVAKVNGDIITRGEIDRTRRQIEQDLRARAGKNLVAAQVAQALAERSQHILRDRIDNLLLVNRGKELNINVDGEVTKYVADLMRQTKEVDPEKFAAMVREQTGMSFEDWKSETRNQLITQRVVRQEATKTMSVKKEEAMKFYEENKAAFMREEQIFLREILLVTEGKKDAEKAAIAKKAADLVARGRKGERFADLARDNSDAESAQAMGDIGGVKKGMMDSKIESLVWDQPKGYVTDPIPVARGLLILKVEEKFKAGQAAFEEVEGEITNRLYEQKMGPVMREYLTKLRQDAFLEIREGWIDTAAAPGKSTKWTDPAQLKPETITKAELEAQPRRKKLLWMVPIPGTKTAPKAASASPSASATATAAKEGESKSRTVKH